MIRRLFLFVLLFAGGLFPLAAYAAADSSTDQLASDLDDVAWFPFYQALEVHSLGHDGSRLWAGGRGGVASFNVATGGARRYGAGLGWTDETIISAVFSHGDGDVWFGTEGEGLWRFDGVSWFNYRYTVEEANWIDDIAPLDGDSFFMATQAGLLLRDSQATYMVFQYPTTAVAVAENGDVWGGTLDGAYLLRPARQPTWFEGAQRGPIWPISSIDVAPNGDVWFGMSYMGVGAFIGDDWFTFSAGNGLPNDYVYDVAAGPDGVAWAATLEGAARYEDGKWTAHQAWSGLNTHWTGAVHVNGNDAFVGTGAGVNQYQDGSWRGLFSGPRKRTDFGVYSVRLAPDGTLWMRATGLMSYDGVRWENFTDVNSPLPTNYIEAMELDLDGNLWVSGWGPPGCDPLARFDGETWALFTEADGLVTLCIFAIARGPDGAMWFAGQEGLVRYDGVDWTVYGVSGEPLPDNVDLMVVTDDAVWMADASHKGLTRFDGTNWSRLYPTSEATFIDLAADGDGNIYALTSKGISRYDGAAWTTYSVDDGLPADRSIRTMRVEENGRVWAGTDTPMQVYVFDGSTWTEWGRQNWPFDGIPHFDPDGINFWMVGGAVHYLGVDRDALPERQNLPLTPRSR